MQLTASRNIFTWGVVSKIYSFFYNWIAGVLLTIRSMKAISHFDKFSQQQWLEYIDRSCREPASQIEKLKLLKSFSSPDRYWIETGTYLGYTTRGLSSVALHVFSLEPSEIYFTKAVISLSNLNNVSVINRSSEDGLSEILHSLEEGSKVSFWLDGHYSAGDTFLGVNHCPIQEELSAIGARLGVIDPQVFIDDFRLFGVEEGYPSKDFLIDWARQNGFKWTVESDILILTKP